MEKRSFEFTVEGQYYGAHDGTGMPVVKNYIAKFLLPSQEAALSIIVKHLLGPYMRKHYPDYARFRTHKITSMATHGRLPDAKVLQMSFEDMGIQDLSDFCILKQIFIDPYKHKNLEICRETVAKLYQDRVDFKKVEEKTGRAAEAREAEELLNLNKLEAEEPGMLNPNEMAIGSALKKGGDTAKVKETVVEETPAGLPPEEESIFS